MTTRITCGWTGERVWLQARDYDRHVTDVLRFDLPKFARYWAPDYPRRRSPGRWYVVPAYAETAWEMLDAIPGVGCYWSPGPHDDERMAAAGVTDMWSAFPPGGLVPRRPDGATAAGDRDEDDDPDDYGEGLLYDSADETDLGWPRLHVVGDLDDIERWPKGWHLVDCHGCGAEFFMSHEEWVAKWEPDEALDPSVLEFCRSSCHRHWTEAA